MATKRLGSGARSRVFAHVKGGYLVGGAVDDQQGRAQLVDLAQVVEFVPGEIGQWAESVRPGHRLAAGQGGDQDDPAQGLSRAISTATVLPMERPSKITFSGLKPNRAVA
jgi:hypothetical protein